MADRQTVTLVRRYVRAVEHAGIEVSFVVLFGSMAKGAHHEWSDIDLVVVSPRFDGTYPRRDSDLLWRVAARVDSRIEPVPCGERQWETDERSVILEIARREGEHIAA